MFVVQLLSCVRLFVTPWTAAHQASCPSPSPEAYSNSCPLSQQCHPTIASLEFLAIIYLDKFFTPISISSPFRTPILPIFLYLVLSQRSQSVLFFHSFFFLFLFSITDFFYSVFQLTDPFLCTFSLLLIPSSVLFSKLL